MRCGGRCSRTCARRRKEGGVGRRVRARTHGHGGRPAASRTEARMQRGRRGEELSRRERSSPAAHRRGRGGSGSTTVAGIWRGRQRRAAAPDGKESAINATPCLPARSWQMGRERATRGRRWPAPIRPGWCVAAAMGRRTRARARPWRGTSGERGREQGRAQSEGEVSSTAPGGPSLTRAAARGGSGIAEERTRARRHGGGSVSTVATGEMPFLQITPCHFSSFLFLFS